VGVESSRTVSKVDVELVSKTLDTGAGSVTQFAVGFRELRWKIRSTSAAPEASGNCGWAWQSVMSI
jgi:hypothetical protein